MIRENYIQPRVLPRVKLPSAGFITSAAAAALTGLYFMAPEPVVQGWALWSLVGIGAGYVLADAWAEQNADA